MSVADFKPQFMKVGVLTAALQELTPREKRDPDPDLAIEEWMQFAHELGVGETTIKAHVSEILRKLEVGSRTQAVIEVSRIDFDSLLAGTNSATAKD